MPVLDLGMPVLDFRSQSYPLAKKCGHSVMCRTRLNLNFTEFDTSFRKFNHLTASCAYVYSISSVS